MMYVKNNIQNKNSCQQIILNSILSKPVTFMRLVSESKCASETVEKYVKILLDDYEINYQIDCERLYDHLPENIDDLDNESEYNSESESELEDGEIRT